MLMSKRRKNFLHLYSSSGAIAVALGTLISAAWADQEIVTGAVTVVDHGHSNTATASEAGSGDMLGEDVQQLRRLATLQQQQIFSQRRALGEVTATSHSRVGLEFLLPANVSGLRDLVLAQQQIIRAQDERFAERDNTEIESATESVAELVSNEESLGQPLVQEPEALAKDLPEQDLTAREAFDRALEEGRAQAAAATDAPLVEVSTVDSVVVAQDMTGDAPTPTEVKVAAEWQDSDPEDSPVVSVPPRSEATEPDLASVSETTDDAESDELNALREQLRQQSDLLERQSRQLEEQRQSVEAQKVRLEQLERQMAEQSEVQPAVTIIQQPAPSVRNAMFVMPRSLEVPGDGTYTLAQDEDSPSEVVGEEQGEQEEQRAREISGVDDAGGVLTRAGAIIVEPSIQYSQSNINRFFFQGLEIVDTVLIGNIEATDSDRDTITAKLGARYGFTSRLEAGVSVPWVYRDDRITRQIVSLNTSTTTVLDGSGIGDVEVSGRYQLNRARPGWPVFVANARYKANTGKGPFEVERDINGIETELATGSGFHGIEPGMTALIRSDPVVFFVNGRYLFHLGRDVDSVVGPNFIGHVDPGDVASFAAGMGFGINEEASFSLGYDHNFVFATETEIDGVMTESTDIDVGSLSMGFSYRINPMTSLNFTVKAGVTEDAPDVQMLLRMPFRF